jgi:hypothetical protein
MGARWYDPVLARWTSPDSIVPDPGNPQALNRYTYVYNNPLRYTDPSGHGPADWLDFGNGMATQFTRDMAFWVSPAVWTTIDALTVVVSQEAPPAAYYEGQQAGRNLSQAVGTAMVIHGGANVVAGLGAMASTGSGGAACAVATGGVCAIPAGALLAGEGALVGVGALEAGYGGAVLLSAKDHPLRTGHAEQRAGQGRPTGPAWNDAQKAGANQVYWDAEHGTYVVNGANGRVHFFVEENGKLLHNSSIKNWAANTKWRLRNGAWEYLSSDQYDIWLSLLDSTVGGQ